MKLAKSKGNFAHYVDNVCEIFRSLNYTEYEYSYVGCRYICESNQ